MPKRKPQNIAKDCFEIRLFSDAMSPKICRRNVQRTKDYLSRYQCRALNERRCRGELLCGRDGGSGGAIHAQCGTPSHRDRSPAVVLLLVHVGLVHVFLFGAVLGDDESNIEGTLTPRMSNENPKFHVFLASSFRQYRLHR